MVIDLFEEEQRICDEAICRIKNVKGGAEFDFIEYEILAKEYGKLLKQLRRSTRIADRTTIDLYESNLDLTDKIHYDVLTGIYNRRFMEESLKSTIKSILRTGGELSVLMIDVDFFKNYNDTYGHSAGDICLKSVAKALKASISRADDFVARYGGEEFIIVMKNTCASGACNIADKVLKNVRELNIFHEKSEAASCITVSIGVTTGYVTKNQSEYDYIERADEALYMSKHSGRNRYTYLRLEEHI